MLRLAPAGIVGEPLRDGSGASTKPGVRSLLRQMWRRGPFRVNTLTGRPISKAGNAARRRLERSDHQSYTPKFRCCGTSPLSHAVNA